MPRRRANQAERAWQRNGNASRAETVSRVLGIAALKAPVWLIELAARDDPPTEIDSRLLARFARAGVARLDPTDGSKSLDESDADRTVGIAAQGAGFGFGESFEGERAPVAAALERLCVFVERFDRLRRLRLAAKDMELVAETARALADRRGPARMFERVLETGLIVTYARPYLDSSKAGLGGKWRPTDKADRRFHDRIITELRHPYHAHADHTPRRTIMDTTEYLGREGAPSYAEAWWRLTDDELAQIAALADKQRERFEAEARRVGAELGEQRE